MKSKTDVSGEFESSEIRKENADAPRDPYACISLPIPSTGYRHDACAICNKKPRKLVIVPEQSRNELFVHTGVLLRSGSRCCPSHIMDRHFTTDTLDSGVTSTIRNTT